MGRISSLPLLSTLFLPSNIYLRITSFSAFPIASFTSHSSMASSSEINFSSNSLVRILSASSLSSVALILLISLSLSLESFFILSSNSFRASLIVISFLFSRPHFFTRSFCKAITSLIYFCARFKASSIFSSLNSFAAASIMTILSSRPVTTKSSLLSSNSLNVGLRTNLSSTNPMRTQPMGPSNGISDIERAALVPFTARISESFSPSLERTSETTCMAFTMPCGKRGRIGLSIRRAVSISFSEGLPSLLKNPPGIFPAAYVFSLYSTVNGRKSMPSLTSLEQTHVTRTTVPPNCTVTAPSACLAILPVSIINSFRSNFLLIRSDINLPFLLKT